MKQHWQKIALKVDALTLRERGLVFAALAAAIIFLVYYLMLAPLNVRQKTFLSQIQQQHNLVIGIDAEIAQKMQASAIDPDVSSRARLKQVKLGSEQMRDALRERQKGLVAPEKIVALLEQILQSNGKLRLVSLKTLPVSGNSEGAFNLPKDGKPAAAVKMNELLYRHGVEIAVQGGYLDLVAYMSALEALPVQIFWGKAALDAEHYPNLKLTLTLYTLSLDQKWMTL